MRLVIAGLGIVVMWKSSDTVEERMRNLKFETQVELRAAKFLSFRKSPQIPLESV
jgi:hypothetical protein